MKLRDVIRSIGTLKNQADGIDRAFGGVNLLLAGDFWQLDPPSGGFLASIPVDFIKKARKYDAAATVAHGQSVFWHQGPGCVQGVTELDECIRCKDEWLFKTRCATGNSPTTITTSSMDVQLPFREVG